MKNLVGEVPAGLADAFDEAIEEMGLIKKRAMVAAVQAFLDLDSDSRMRMYHSVYQRYYSPEGAPAATESAVQPVEPHDEERPMSLKDSPSDSIR